MFTSVNIYSSVAVYVQIENEVQFAVASGKLKPGDKLPSVRQVSETLTVNPNTVAKAFRDLEVMGIVFTRRGMGVYISKDAQERCRKNCRGMLARKTFQITQEALSMGLSKKVFSDLISRCWAIDGSPYDDVPQSILNAAKRSAAE